MITLFLRSPRRGSARAIGRSLIVVAGALAFLGYAPAQDKSAKTAKKPVEDRRYDDIVDAFIAYDVGQLRGQAGQQANAAFQSMSGEESIPALVRGMNKAARINNSCPILVISRKLSSVLAANPSEKMLLYAVDNLDGGDMTPYGSYVTSMRQQLDAQLAAANGGKSRFKREVTFGTPGALRRSQTAAEKWSVADLKDGVAHEKDAALVQILEQLQNRKGAEYTALLTDAIEQVDDDMKPLARGLLAQRLARMTDNTLKQALKSSNDELRAAAARAIGYKGSPLCSELAEAVRDSSDLVGENAHGSLVKLVGEDLGPPAGAPLSERFVASKRWLKRIAESETQ